MNLVIPLAGKDPRFPDRPKCLIEANGKPIIAHVFEHLGVRKEDTVIFIVLEEHVQKFQIDDVLRKIAGSSAIVRILPGVTAGSPLSILEGARDLIESDTDILVALGDVICDIEQLYRDVEVRRREVSGIIPVELLDRTGEYWGYVQADEKGVASVLLEKEPTYVAPWATMGLYYFSHGKDFVWAVEEMVRRRSFVYHDMFFVGPVYNELIRRGDTVIISKNKMLTELRGPADVEKFLEKLSH